MPGLRFASLGSGSEGNALVIEAGRTRLLLDCGFAMSELERRLARSGLAPSDLSGIIVTHEHADHGDGVFPLARRYALPVWLTHGTLAALRGADGTGDEGCSVGLVEPHRTFSVGDLVVHPFTVPHDAREPVQYVVSDGARKLGVLTDTGCSTASIEASLSGCNALVIECNHDAAMLARGPYPPSLKERIGGRFGHLDNEATAGLLARLDRSRLSHVIAAHLSRTNNTPELARSALSRALGCAPGWLGVATQEGGFDWRDLG
jgi:phosphoribosyl 1,2-cyclic phosphodiesterase